MLVKLIGVLCYLAPNNYFCSYVFVLWEALLAMFKHQNTAGWLVALLNSKICVVCVETFPQPEWRLLPCIAAVAASPLTPLSLPAAQLFFCDRQHSQSEPLPPRVLPTSFERDKDMKKGEEIQEERQK
jgi:hypothetical protein